MFEDGERLCAEDQSDPIRVRQIVCAGLMLSRMRARKEMLCTRLGYFRNINYCLSGHELEK